nr:response regulator [Dysgonomonas sp. 520]
MFELYANKKGIETDINSEIEEFYTKFDHDVIEKIFTNLFSNAIKYTSDNGFVGVKIKKTTQEEISNLELLLKPHTEYISIAVTNTDAEIPDDKQEEIFESFNRLSSGRPAFEESTGLGLAIVKELVSSLDGKIILHSADSKVTFTVILPFTLDTENTDSNTVSYEYTISEIDNILAESKETNLNDNRSRKAHSIVVIEDNPDLRNYMEQQLLEFYNVYTAVNGSEGIVKVEKIYPQIVITDLMMPEMDGFEVCRTLRSNIKTSHIPIIVLSGMGKKTGNKIKALDNGANVFIDKPFEMDFLLKQVDNLIKNQKELKELYSKKYIAEPSKITISSMDEELLKKAMEHIEQNISNNNYNVESFVSDMAIGRTLLYQKINDITGMSIKEFIMDVRLKRSAQLLKESDLTISEIADMTGFVNPKYFSICFKKHFELTPSEFKKKS